MPRNFLHIDSKIGMSVVVVNIHFYCLGVVFNIVFYITKGLVALKFHKIFGIFVIFVIRIDIIEGLCEQKPLVFTQLTLMGFTIVCIS